LPQILVPSVIVPGGTVIPLGHGEQVVASVAGASVVPGASVVTTAAAAAAVVSSTALTVDSVVPPQHSPS